MDFKYTTWCNKCNHQHHYRVNIGKRYKCKKCGHTEYTQTSYGMEKPEYVLWDGYMYYYECPKGHPRQQWRVPAPREVVCTKCNKPMILRKELYRGNSAV